MYIELWTVDIVPHWRHVSQSRLSLPASSGNLRVSRHNAMKCRFKKGRNVKDQSSKCPRESGSPKPSQTVSLLVWTLGLGRTS